MHPSIDTLIGQMLMFGFRGAYPQDCQQIRRDIQDYGPGGIWLTDNNSPLGQTIGNIASPIQLKNLIADLQAVSKIPLFVAIDAEGGAVIRLKEQYGFPATQSARSLGEKNDPVYTESCYAAVARNLKGLGINFNFAPVADLNLAPQNPALGAKGRCFSADPAVVTNHARATVSAHRRQGILTCLKHFPGHGSAQEDSHLGMVDITQSWTEQELLPFKTLIGEGLTDAVLVAHVMHWKFDPEFPASLSRAMVTGMLREKLDFNGLVISDDLNMGAIRNYFKPRELLARALNAGTDVLVFSNLHPYNPNLIAETVGLIKELLDEGRVSEKQILDANSRIQNAKSGFIL